MEFSIKLCSGMVLKGILESPGEKTKGVVILVHGIGEHIQRYTNWVALFNNRGIGVVGVDLPGHGRSPGRKGHLSDYGVVGEMLDILINTSRQTFPGVPLYLYGHSLGGGIVLDYILRHNPRVKGAIVTSPWLRLSYEPPRIKLMLASAIRYVLPGMIQSSGLDVNHISHDPQEVEKYKADPLIHDKISVSTIHNAVSAGKYVMNHSSDLKIPVLLLHGGDDKITSPTASKEFAAGNTLTEFRQFEGGYHELHNEPFRLEVFDVIINWIENLR
jgi:acylglycerol lipase